MNLFPLPSGLQCKGQENEGEQENGRGQTIKEQAMTLNASECKLAGITDADRKAILNNHNVLRSQIAKGTYIAKKDKKPPATNMKKMFWDCGLEASAQAYANKCPDDHSGAGENLFWSWSTVPINISVQGLAACGAWQSEFQKYGWASNLLNMGLFNSGIGHATQMAWWNTNKIGCGVKVCPSSMARLPYQVNVVCHYRPYGNILNTNIYNSGKTCSACGSGFKCEKATVLCIPA